MKKIFIINGSGGVGKDYFISLLDEVSPFKIINYSSIDKVKEIAEIIGWNGEKTERARQFLFDLKALCTEYNDMPFNLCKEVVDSFKNDNEAQILFLHIREPEEIERAKQAFGAATVLIRKASVPQIFSNDADGRVLEYDYDIHILNDGTPDELKDLARKFRDDFLADNLASVYNSKEFAG